jgi:AAA domain
VLELVGPAGAGKSTVFATLRARDASVDGQPVLRTRRHAATLAAGTASSLATLARSRVLGGSVTVEQLRMMAYLHALPGVLARRDGARGPVVLDQGPVFFLTRPILMDARLERWRERTLADWRPILDAVVWLDAPDDVLVERINARAKRHALKGAPAPAAIDVLTRARADYEALLARLEADEAGPLVLRFDTSHASADEVADRVLLRARGATAGRPS